MTAVFLAAASGLLRLRAEDRTRWSVKSATAFVAGLVIIAIALTAAVSAHRRELATHVADYGTRVVVDVAEVDPVVIRVALEYFGLEAGPRLRLHHADGRAFVRLAETRYDLIVLDAYSTNRYGSTIPAHLTTREFFAECAARILCIMRARLA